MAAKVKGRAGAGAGGNVCYRGPYGTPLAHVHYQQSRHLNPERTPFHRHEKPVSIRLLDVSKESLDNLRQVAASVKRLLAPSLQLKTVPDSLVAYLGHLERLDLSHNRLNDSSFPDAMRSLDRLAELCLSHNHLTRVPPCLKRMRNLVRLNLSNNLLESVAGLEKLRKLQFLVLDHNQLSAVFREVSSLRRLEMLQCSSNNLRDVPRDVRTLRQLKDLDLSNNRILLLPTDLFQLPRLEFLNASQNQVSKIPSFNVKIQNRHWICCVDLSDNHLVKFPGHLMHMAHKLDLSANKIRTLSWSTFKKLDDAEQEVILEGNPLVYPPPDVCLSGLKTIVRFFQESQADVKTYQGVKVVVLGSHSSGKSSLVYSLVDQQARLAQDMTDTAAGIDAYEMSFDYDAEEGTPGMSLNLCVWDLCGNPFYLYPHYLFHEQPSITILTFSLPDYTDQSFGQQIGSWFDWMIAKSNKLVVILVGTQSDRVSEKRAQAITQQVRAQLSEHIHTRQQMMEARIKDIETRPVISPTLSEQLKTYMRLLQAKFTVQSDIILTSSKEFRGFGRLKEAIEALASDRKLFPHVMRVIPTFWVEVENWVEERGNALIVPVMQWEAYSEEVTHRFGMKHLLNAITQYLHDAGKVLWFSNVPSLKNLVFMRPAWVFDLLKLLFRHDLHLATFTPDDTLKVIGFTPGKFERLKQEFIRDGVVSRDLLKGLLVSLLPADVAEPMSQVLQILTENFQMGYPVSKTPNDLTFTYAPESESPESAATIHRLLLPWFRRGGEPASFRQQWQQLRGRNRLAALFRFPSYMPPGLFEIMTVLAHRDKHQLVFLAHWGGGVHARHKTEKVQLLFTYYKQGSLEQQDEEEDAEEDKEEEEEDTDSVEEKAPTHSTHSDINNSGGKVPARLNGARNGSRQKLTRSNSKGPMNAAQNGDVANSSYSAKTKPRQLLEEEDNARRQDSVEENDEEEDEDDIDEDEEEEEEEEEDTEDVDVDSTSGVDKEVSRRGLGLGSVTRVDREVGEGEGSKRRKVTGGVKARQQGDGVLLRMPPEMHSNDASNIVLKFEMRDNSEDEQDQTPAAAMWNLLLPLLQDFEDLLLRYTGVLVERRTQCPLCGEGSFAGEWLTPKETQGLHTRTCEACHQHVDTAFLVQPREKKRVIINGNRFKRAATPNTPNSGETNTTSCEPSSDAPSGDVAAQ